MYYLQVFCEENAGVGSLPQHAVVQQAVRGREISLGLRRTKRVPVRTYVRKSNNNNNNNTWRKNKISVTAKAVISTDDLNRESQCCDPQEQQTTAVLRLQSAKISSLLLLLLSQFEGYGKKNELPSLAKRYMIVGGRTACVLVAFLFLRQKNKHQKMAGHVAQANPVLPSAVQHFLVEITARSKALLPKRRIEEKIRN